MATARSTSLRVGRAWIQQAEITDLCPCSSEDQFGQFLALRGDIALIGAPGKDGDVHGRGAAYIFTRVGATWSQQAVLTAADGVPSANFGLGVALSADGTSALIGAPGDAGDRGEAYVFARRHNVDAARYAHRRGQRAL